MAFKTGNSKKEAYIMNHKFFYSSYCIYNEEKVVYHRDLGKKEDVVYQKFILVTVTLTKKKQFITN